MCSLISALLNSFNFPKTHSIVMGGVFSDVASNNDLAFWNKGHV